MTDIGEPKQDEGFVYDPTSTLGPDEQIRNATYRRGIPANSDGSGDITDALNARLEAEEAQQEEDEQFYAGLDEEPLGEPETDEEIEDRYYENNKLPGESKEDFWKRIEMGQYDEEEDDEEGLSEEDRERRDNYGYTLAELAAMSAGMSEEEQGELDAQEAAMPAPGLRDNNKWSEDEGRFDPEEEAQLARLDEFADELHHIDLYLDGTAFVEALKSNPNIDTAFATAINQWVAELQSRYDVAANGLTTAELDDSVSKEIARLNDLLTDPIAAEKFCRQLGYAYSSWSYSNLHRVPDGIKNAIKGGGLTMLQKNIKTLPESLKQGLKEREIAKSLKVFEDHKRLQATRARAAMMMSKLGK